MDRAAIAAIAALDDDVRRALFEYVRLARTPVTREDAAAAVGISRKLAAFHLDKLVSLGLLRSGFADATARRVGRTPRVYEPTDVDVTVQVPERAPDLLAEILLAAVTHDPDGGSESARRTALRVARERGIDTGVAAADGGRRRIGIERALCRVQEVLARLGFHPYRTDSGLRLRNCVFHRFGASSPELVCGLNCAYVGGILEGLGVDGRVEAELAPRPGECCVQLRPASRD